MKPPRLEYDPDLPISAWVDDIATAIRDHQVVVVAGETGSGKTTQLPKICLQVGRTSIGHTQPRRIAARSVAERLASELDTPLGNLVGYQVRFTRQAGRDTRVKVMTDGVLLAEIGHDRELRRYDTIIIDEAHERSLNIDFLLGYLKQLLPRRPDLKVIITSATIDTARFAAHFADAPVIEVAGRSYPVDVRYRPLEDKDQTEGIVAALTELRRADRGDVLVFCSGEREIRDAMEAITAQKWDVEVAPLFARLSAAEQQRIFAPHPGQRIVVATNVAETSLTVPGIRSVVDVGTARLSRYSARTKVQRLPIEPISRASANQRAGRCGRVAPGICIRLYSEEDFAARPEFTEPEILRTNLASVILRMADAGLGDIADFPFVEPPDHARIADGLRLLDELGALSHGSGRTRGRGRGRGRGAGRDDAGRTGAAEPAGPRLTKVGRQLSRMPVDPRLARMLVAADQLDCLADVLVIVAGLAIQDPRERPAEQREAAEALHRRFWAPLPSGTEDTPDPDGSDFIAWLRLWQYLEQQRRDLSGNQFRKRCRAEYLNYVRVREWQDLHAQLREITRDLDLRSTDTGRSFDPDRIHRALLTGLLSNIGLAEVAEPRANTGRAGRRRGPRTYTGARGTQFAINPGSAVARTPPELVMAAEIVETTRLWARTVAGIDARWVEEAGRHLVKRSYGEPHFSAQTSRVVAPERVTLLGVPIIADRRVDYTGVNPTVAREVFIRSGLVEQQWRTRHRFFTHNAALRAEAAEIEERTRRRGVVVDDEVLYAFYDTRLPKAVTSGATFDTWWREHGDDGLLDLSMDVLVGDDLDASAFPDTWRVGEHDLPVSYVWSPGAGHDGVSVEIDLRLLNQVPAAAFSWQVPGLRTDLVVAMIRSLPKALRTNFVPAPDVATRALAWLRDREVDRTTTGLPEALSQALRALTGVEVPLEAWGTHPIPDHLQVGFVVVDPDRGRPVGRGKDLGALRNELTGQVSESLTKLMPSPARGAAGPSAGRQRVTGATDWSFGDVPVEARSAGGAVGYPAVVDEATGVGVLVLDHPERAAIAHRGGIRRLLTLTTQDPTLWVIGHLSNHDKLAIADNPYPDVPAMLADARLKAVADCAVAHRELTEIRSRDSFAAVREQIRPEVPTRMRAVVSRIAEILRQAALVRAAIADLPTDAEIRADLSGWLDDLLYPGFVTATPEPHFDRLVVYLRAAEHRIRAWSAGGRTRDQQAMEQFLVADDAYAELLAGFPPGPVPGEVAEIGWLLEEYRVSLFAQQLGTRVPVSAKRLRRGIEAAPRSWS